MKISDFQSSEPSCCARDTVNELGWVAHRVSIQERHSSLFLDLHFCQSILLCASPLWRSSTWLSSSSKLMIQLWWVTSVIQSIHPGELKMLLACCAHNNYVGFCYCIIWVVVVFTFLRSSAERMLYNALFCCLFTSLHKYLFFIWGLESRSFFFSLMVCLHPAADCKAVDYFKMFSRSSSFHHLFFFVTAGIFHPKNPLWMRMVKSLDPLRSIFPAIVTQLTPRLTMLYHPCV